MVFAATTGTVLVAALADGDVAALADGDVTALAEGEVAALVVGEGAVGTMPAGAVAVSAVAPADPATVLIVEVDAGIGVEAGISPGLEDALGEDALVADAVAPTAGPVVGGGAVTVAEPDVGTARGTASIAVVDAASGVAVAGATEGDNASDDALTESLTGGGAIRAGATAGTGGVGDPLAVVSCAASGATLAAKSRAIPE